MDQTEFTSLYCARPENFAWFLGAGTSRNAGLPTAMDIIWDLKRRYYCREENQVLSRQDVQNAAQRATIQAFVDSRGFPAEWAPEEYSTYFEKIFGDDRERQRAYLTAILSEEKVTLSVGNRVLSALMSAGLARAVFTTNFDSVVEKAMADVSGRSLSAYHIEGAVNANQALNNEEYPLYCKIHGDFRYDSIKNLEADLAKQNEELSKCLINAANRFGFIVSGYSGRDESVMKLFHAALESNNPFPHGLYWTGIKGSPVPPLVTALLGAVKAVGVKAAYVETETFDALLLRLWRNLSNQPADLDNKIRRHQIADVQIPLPPPGNSAPIMRLNVLPLLELPTRAQRVSFTGPKEWKDLRDAERNSEGRLIFTKGDAVWCWGDENELREEFGKDIASLAEDDLSEQLAALDRHLHLKGFLESALAQALARDKPLLARRGRYGAALIVDRSHQAQDELESLFRAVGGKLHGQITGLFTPITDWNPEPQKMFWAESLEISVAEVNGLHWLNIDPNIWIWPRWARKSASDFLDQHRKDRYNAKYNALLSAWIEIILGTKSSNTQIEVTAFEGEVDAANPKFVIGSRTGFSRRLAE